MIYKKLRNKKKKLEKIEQTVQKIKNKEIVPNQEQQDMVNSKGGIEKEMQEQEAILAQYKEAFPDNPAFAKGKKKQKKAAKEQSKEQITAPI